MGKAYKIPSKSCAWEVTWPSMDLRWSSESYALFEISEDIPINSERFLKCVHNNDRNKFEDAFHESVRNKKVYEQHFRVNLPQKKQRYIACYGVTEYDEMGNPKRTVGTFVDETKMVVTNRLLEKRNQEFEHLTQSLQDIVYVVNKQYAFEKVYGNTLETFGISSHLFLNKTIDQLFGEAVAAQHHQAHAYALDGNQHVYEWEFESNGIIRFMQSTLSPTFDKDGHVDGVLGVARDVSAIKRSKLEQTKLFQAIEYSPICVVITDVDGNIEYVNPYFEQLTGYSMSEVVGKKPNVLKSGYQDETFYANLWGTILSGETWKGVFKNKKKNGQAYWESAVISPVKDHDGNIINFVALKQDISLQKRVQDRLNRENEYKSSLLRSIPEVIIVFDQEGIIQDFKGDENDLGTESFIRVGYSIWEVFDAHNSRLIIGHLKQLTLKTEMRHFKIEINNDLGSKVFEIRMVRINAYRFMLTASDVTKAEKDLLDLKEASKVMKSQNERLQMFTFTVSHHLRSHTANMEGIFNLMMVAEPELMSHPFIELLRKSAKQLSDTIENLNDISDSVEIEKSTQIQQNGSVKTTN